MPRQVSAFGKMLSFPDDMTEEQMLGAIKANEHLLNPDYKQPLMDKAKNFARDVFGYGQPSIAEQAEATAPDSAEVVAPQMRGAPVRQSVYNKALVDRLPGDESAIQNRINKTAGADLSGQRLQSGIGKAITDTAPDPEGGHIASAISSVGQTIKGAGQFGTDYFNADKDNFVLRYGQKLIDENPLAVKSLVDIKEKPLLAVSESTGNAVGSMAGMAATKLAGLGISSLAPLTGPLAPVVFAAGKAVEWLGPAAIAALPSYGSIREKQILNDPKNEEDAKSIAIATLGAGAVGAIEVAFGPQQWALSMMTKEGRAAISRKFASTSVGEAMIKGVLKGGAIEGAEEIAQNPIEQLASYEDPTTKANMQETLFGGAMGAIGGGVIGGGIGGANKASRNIKAENLRSSRQEARAKAQNINQQIAQKDVSDITNAQSVDEAINAASKAATRKPVTEDDVHRATDPTLADIERLTGLKPSETIETVINETQKPVEIQKETESPKQLAKATNEIVLPDNSSISYQWDVVDADQIKATLKNGQNQPRDRTRAASDIQIQSIAKQPDYRRLSESPVMDVGAPVITADGAIVAGNGRFEALDRAYGQGTHQKYLESLINDLPGKGIDPQVIQGMKKPVLVRRLTQPVDTRKLAVASNSGGGLQYSSLELAGIDASRMQGLDNLDFNDLGELSLNNNNYQTLKRAFSGYNAEELAAMQDARGMLSQDGMRRVRNAVLAKAYGDSKALGRLIDTTDNNLRNVLGALTKAASTVAKTKDMIDSGAIPKELDVTENFLDSVDVIHNLKSRNIDLTGFLSQKNIFGDEIDADTREILQYLNDNIRSQKKLTEFIKNVYGAIASIDTRTDNIFGDNALPTKQEILRNAKTRTDQPIFAGLEEDQGVSKPAEQNAIPKASDVKSGEEPNFSRDAKDRIKNLERTRKLQKSFDQEGYGLTAKAADVRDFIANDGRKRNEAIASEQIAKAFGKRVTWVDVTGEFDINGVVVPSIKDTIFIDIKTNKAAHAVLGHELSHHMEYDAPQAYKNMLAALDPLIKDHEGYAKAKEIDGASRDFLIKEIVGDLIGDNFTNQKFWNKVAEYNPSAFKRIADVINTWINRLLDNIRGRGLGSEKWVTDIEKAQDIIAKAVSEYVGNTGQQSAQSDAVIFSKPNKDYETRGGKNLSRFEGDGKVFETGKPVTFNYLHNKESATKLFGKPRKDSAFGRFYEPSGKYVVQVTNDTVARQNPDQYEYGELSFNNPLVLVNNDLSWKEELSKVYDGKTGKNLSIALIQDGYDGVVTVDKYGTSEILDLKSFDETKAKFSKQERDQINAAELKIPTIQSPDLKYRIGDLPRDMREELFGEHAMNLNPEATERGFYAKFVPSGLIFIRDLKIDKIPANQLEEIKSARLADLPPIVIADGRLIDGQHRIQAAREKGYSQLRYIDVTGLIDTNAGGYVSEIPDMYLVKKESSGDAKFSKAEVDRTLIAQHNLSIKNLLHVDKIGGLAAPSIAITDKAHPLHGFGEITLLAEKDLIDPKQGAKTFGSDIYSPRYPQLTYDFTGAPIKKLNALLADGKEATGDNDYYNSSLENDPERELAFAPAALYQFLKKEGKEPDIKYIQPQEISEKLKPFAQESGDEFDLTQNKSFKDAAIKEYYNQFKIAGIDPINLDENGEKRIIRSYAGQVVNYKNAVKNQGKIDREGTRYALKKQVQDNGLDNKFENYIAELISEANPRERIFQGFTYSGSRRYADHNIDNVIKILKKNLRGGENFNYGLGSIRSKYAPQFKSIKQIRDSKNRLMDSAKFDEVKKEVNQELTELTEELNKYGTFSGFDNVDMMLFDVATMGVNKSLEENGFKNVPAELKLEIGKFINKLKDMPTEYFEAKVLRAVSLGEFSVAIIPDDSPKKVREILQRNGIEDIREYKSGDNEDRVRKINEVDRVMFSRASKTELIPEAINIDGVDRPTRNSEGKLIHPTEEGIRNFWRWFSGSKVVDERGRPRVVYHGTKSDINKFNNQKSSISGAFFFSENRDVAGSGAFTGSLKGGGNVIPVYLKISNPSIKLDMTDNPMFESSVIAKAKENGSDGIGVTKDKRWIAFNPNQIKSAIGNTGAFSDRLDIRFSFAGEKSESESNAPEREQENILPKETTFRKFQREWQDDFNRFQVFKDWLNERGIQLSEKADVSLAEERFHAKVANQIEDFRDFTVSPLIERIAKAGFTMQDVADFLEAQHASEANAQIQKLYDDPSVTAYGVTDEEAKAYLDKAPEELKNLANEFRDITEKAKKLRLDNGLLNTDITGAWESTYKHYIPVKGAEEKQPGSGKGLSVKFKPKRRLGHGRRDEAVVENIIHDYERAVYEVEKNRVGKHLAMMAAEINLPELMTIDAPVKRKALKNVTAYQVQVKGATRAVFDTIEAAKVFKEALPLIDKKIATGEVVIAPTTDQRIAAMASPMLADNEINVYIDGHAIRLQINDELAARVYKKLGVEGFGKLVAAGRALNGYLSKVYTGYNPEFILKNLQRDFQTGLLNLTGEEGMMMAARAAYNYPKMFADLFRYAVSNRKNSTKWIDQYRATGGNTGAAYLSDMERLGKEVATEYAAYQGVMSNLKQGKPGFAARAAGKKAYNVFLKWIYNMNQAGENAMRLAAFKAMIDSGKTENEAAHIAKNITVNFNRKGENGQIANAAWLFFNASVQGQAATMHALFKGKHKGQAWALASAYATIGYLAAASLGGGDEDDYDKIDDYTKERNLLISTGDGGWIKLAVPYGYGFFYNTGRVLADAQRKDELGVLPWHVMSSAIEEMTPFGDIVVGSDEQFKMDQVLLGIMPTVAKIPLQVAFNKQLFSGSELMPSSDFDESQPDRDKMFRGTKGTVYDNLAGLLENIGFDVSPETLKYSFRTGTGGAGALVDTSISATMLKSQGAELDPGEVPFIRTMYHENNVRADRAAFHKARKEAQTTAEELQRAIKKNDFAKASEITKDKVEMLMMDKYADKLRKLISIERDAQDSVRLDPNLTSAEKRLKLEEMEKRESAFYDQYLDVFKTKKAEMKAREN